MDYAFAALDLADESPENQTRLRGFHEAVARAFHDGRATDDQYDQWRRIARRQEAWLHGFWRTGDPYASALPAATLAAWTGTVACGRDVLPAHLISDVTTAPDARRQGLSRRLLTGAVEKARAEGVPLLALTVSEATIYSRYGFGPSTWRQEVEVDTSAGFALREEYADPGRVVLLEPVEAWPLVSAVLDAWHAARPGSVERPEAYPELLRAELDVPDEDLKKNRVAVHLDSGGDPDGFAIWKPTAQDAEGYRTVHAEWLAGLTPTAELALWQHLAGIDLAKKATAKVATDSPARMALRDVNRWRTTGVTEHIWTRIVDVPRALTARSWYADGEAVITIDDPQQITDGSYRIRATDGVAQVERVEPVEGAADAVQMTSETLATWYLGGTDVATLAAAGRFGGTPEAAAALARLADGGPAPMSLVSF